MKKFDVCARTGTYTDRDGQEKGRWLNCGAVFETDKGLSLKLESVPVGADWNGWFSLFEPKPRGNASGASYAAASRGGDEPPPFEDSEIPF